MPTHLVPGAQHVLEDDLATHIHGLDGLVGGGGLALKGLGFTEDNTNYVNTGKKLSELLGEDFLDKAQKLRPARRTRSCRWRRSGTR